MSPEANQQETSTESAISPRGVGDGCDADGASTVSLPDSVNDAEKRPRQDASAEQGASELPAKKAKRGKYISRACTYCQRRKVKCEGGDPCAQCVAKKRPCISTRTVNVPQAQVQNESEMDGTGTLQDGGSGSINREILARLAALERQFSQAQPSNPYLAANRIESPGARIPIDGQPNSASAELQNALETDGQTFAGELSMTPAFEDETERLHSANTASSGIFPDYPSPGSSLDRPAVRRLAAWLENILAQYGVAPDEQQWRHDLQVYMDEIHPFYPFLHPPTVWKTFNNMWEHSSRWSKTDLAADKHERISVALVYLCLALGRCSVLSRVHDTSGVYSSGWNLYSVGMSLLSGVIEASNTTTKSLVMVQVLIVRVIYLFRLDANQQAAQILALIVSIAHNIGMHNQSTLDTMPVFRNQLYCRTWWTIYILDRRIAIESGKPFLIQDGNIDTVLPLDLSDEWMSRFATRNETVAELHQEIANEIVREGPISHIPYILTMIRYSRVAGKAWQVLYSLQAPSTSISNVVKHLDTILCKLLDTAPNHLRYNSDVSSEAQYRSSPRWQVKQTLILFTSCTYLRLLIRRPFVLGSKALNRTGDDEFEPAALCASLATSILNTHQNIKDEGLKYCFALSHYLTSCTMVMLGLVTREPGLKRKYSELVFAATRSLNVYCHRNWVSGKMRRLVSRLNHLVQSTLPRGTSEICGVQSPARLRRGSTLDNQLATRAEDNTACRMTGSTGTPAIESIERSYQPLDADDGTRMKQWPSGLSYNSDAAPPSIMAQSTGSERRDSLGAWCMADPLVGDQINWAMPDFNFDAVMEGGGRIGPAGPDPLAFSNNGRFNATRLVSRTGGNFDLSKMNALGLGNANDFDMEMDLSITSLWDSELMLDLDNLG